MGKSTANKEKKKLSFLESRKEESAMMNRNAIRFIEFNYAGKSLKGITHKPKTFLTKREIMSCV